MARPPELSDPSVTSVRVLYPDLHGIARGKDVPIGEFDHIAGHGLGREGGDYALDFYSDLKTLQILDGSVR